MSWQHNVGAWRPLARRFLSRPPSVSIIRHQSSRASRIDRITSKLPRRLQKYTTGLRNAPVSHVVSFLILHELTAIVPLFALFGLFHYTNYVPLGYMTEHFGSYVDGALARFERYFARKGWFGFEKDTLARDETTGQTDTAVERWQNGEQRYRILVEVALAYAVTKVLLPVRIIGSVWATPWFAGIIGGVTRIFSRKS